MLSICRGPQQPLRSNKVYANYTLYFIRNNIIGGRHQDSLNNIQELYKHSSSTGAANQATLTFSRWFY